MCQGLLLTGPPSRSGLYLWCLKLAACGLYILPPDFILYFAYFCQGSMLMFRSAMKLFSWPLDACSSIVIFFIFTLLFDPITSIHAKRWMLSYFFDRYYIYFNHKILSFVWPSTPRPACFILITQVTGLLDLRSRCLTPDPLRYYYD